MDKMTFKMALDNLCLNYGKYGMSRSDFAKMLKSGIEQYGLSLRACYLGVKLIAAQETGEHEFFTSADVAEITGESIEEVNRRIEEIQKDPVSHGFTFEEVNDIKPINPVRFSITL